MLRGGGVWPMVCVCMCGGVGVCVYVRVCQ
jgi:hypothetical protein